MAASELVPVEARRVAWVAGVLAALYVAVLFCSARVPDRVMRWFGVPGGAFGRDGGMRLTWRPPPDFDERSLEPMFAAHPDVEIGPAEDGLVLDVPGIAADAVEVTAQRIGGAGRLEFHEVLELPEMAKLAGVLGLPLKNLPVDLYIDQWRPEDGGGTHTDYFLAAPTRQELAAKLAIAAQAGWKLPPGARIVFGREGGVHESWRTYVVADEVALDGSDVYNATGTLDPNTNRAIVLIDFDRRGAQLFGELTTRIAGHKLATLLDGHVVSAPIINGPIRGGKAVITMGGGDPVQQERERDELVATLRGGALPPGGRVVSASYVPGGETAVKRWSARLALAIAAGLVVAAVAWLAVRLVRPQRRREHVVIGARSRSLAVRLAWTALGVVALAIGWSILLPGVNGYELEQVIGAGSGRHWFDTATLSVFSLGLVPAISASVVVEIALWLVPRWRRLRDGDADARRRVGFAVAIATIVLAGTQAYFITTYMRDLNVRGMHIVDLDGIHRWAVIASFVAGTLCLVWVASLITQRGLGNGFAVLLVAGLVLRVIDSFPAVGAAQLALVAAGVACISVVALAVTRWRVGGPRSVALPLPSAGLLPLSAGGGLAVLVGLLTSVGAIDGTRAASWLEPFELELVAICAVIAAAFAWSLAFVAPGRRRRELGRVELAPADRSSWLRATALSALVLVAFYAIARSARTELPVILLDPYVIVLATATIADLIAEARARRRDLAPVWQLHDPLLADAVADRLAGADIACFLQGRRARTWLTPFASYVPIAVLVPSDRAQEAEHIVGELLYVPDRGES